ncbi:hypothetical protein KSP40_PGU002824 [Platanthera guangdongensis]|uniref:Uncharacterized protein n=1 Tax=Platanthera guangdongensis TaxID=2320717 RepID=A0ABR2LL20_9ASPA
MPEPSLMRSAETSTKAPVLHIARGINFVIGGRRSGGGELEAMKGGGGVGGDCNSPAEPAAALTDPTNGVVGLLRPHKWDPLRPPRAPPVTEASTVTAYAIPLISESENLTRWPPP